MLSNFNRIEIGRLKGVMPLVMCHPVGERIQDTARARTTGIEKKLMKKNDEVAASLTVAKTAMWSITMTKRSSKTRLALKKGSLWGV